MSHGRVVEMRLERLLPMMEELFVAGCFTREEIKDINRRRTQHEYQFMATPIHLIDVNNAIDFEKELEERISLYCGRTQVKLHHRWGVLDRIERIFGLGVRRCRVQADKEALFGRYVDFLRQYGRQAKLSAIYARQLLRYPTRGDWWADAMWHEYRSYQNVENARAIIMKGIKQVPLSSDLAIVARVAHFHLELQYVKDMLKSIAGGNRTKKESKRKTEGADDSGAEEEGEKRDEDEPVGETYEDAMAGITRNPALKQILVDLVIAKATFRESFMALAPKKEKGRPDAECTTRALWVAALRYALRCISEVTPRYSFTAELLPSLLHEVHSSMSGCGGLLGGSVGSGHADSIVGELFWFIVSRHYLDVASVPEYIRREKKRLNAKAATEEVGGKATTDEDADDDATTATVVRRFPWTALLLARVLTSQPVLLALVVERLLSLRAFTECFAAGDAQHASAATMAGVLFPVTLTHAGQQASLNSLVDKCLQTVTADRSAVKTALLQVAQQDAVDIFGLSKINASDKRFADVSWCAVVGSVPTVWSHVPPTEQCTIVVKSVKKQLGVFEVRARGADPSTEDFEELQQVVSAAYTLVGPSAKYIPDDLLSRLDTTLQQVIQRFLWEGKQVAVLSGPRKANNAALDARRMAAVAQMSISFTQRTVALLTTAPDQPADVNSKQKEPTKVKQAKKGLSAMALAQKRRRHHQAASDPDSSEDELQRTKGDTGKATFDSILTTVQAVGRLPAQFADARASAMKSLADYLLLDFFQVDPSGNELFANSAVIQRCASNGACGSPVEAGVELLLATITRLLRHAPTPLRLLHTCIAAVADVAGKLKSTASNVLLTKVNAMQRSLHAAVVHHSEGKGLPVSWFGYIQFLRFEACDLRASADTVFEAKMALPPLQYRELIIMLNRAAVAEGAPGPKAGSQAQPSPFLLEVPAVVDDGEEEGDSVEEEDEATSLLDVEFGDVPEASAVSGDHPLKQPTGRGKSARETAKQTSRKRRK